MTLGTNDANFARVNRRHASRWHKMSAWRKRIVSDWKWWVEDFIGLAIIAGIIFAAIVWTMSG